MSWFPINSSCFLSVSRLRVPIGCTTEVNHLGHQFLQRLFDKYDEVSCTFVATHFIVYDMVTCIKNVNINLKLFCLS